MYVMTEKRFLWSIGVGFAGFIMGEFSGGDKGALIGLLWGISVGYGFGSIFDGKSPIKRVVYYWIPTLAIAAIPFGLVIGAAFQPSVVRDTVDGLVGALMGALLGLFIGRIQLTHSRRKLAAPKD